MSFDDIIDRRGTRSAKWDAMEPLYGVSPDDGLAMWVADMDFRSPECVIKAAQDLTDHGVFGYRAGNDDYKAAIIWWMENRHNWTVKPEEIFTTYGLVNAVGMCLNTYTEKGDEIVLFTPVYHAFAKVINNAGRRVKECELVQKDGVYHMDFDAYDAQMTGAEKMLILCSPHNPSGRLWSEQELRDVAAFAQRHDLLIVSDEIHHDIVYPGKKHHPMPLAAPDCLDRLIMLTAPSKTFNIAGNHDGNVIIHDADLRAKFNATMLSLGVSSTLYGTEMTKAAYSPEGAKWVDEMREYIAENARVFDEGINAIPGLKSMPMDSTYLAWVDFSGTGMPMSEVLDRVRKQAKIAPNDGPTFGTGGEPFLRFNLGTPRANVEEAISRLQSAFADLQ
ncbi:MalY/PatB family protein [Amylibacter sp. IMCC11727]|uniref:MalY/PatB family protein n=1 Tax=Amylibacter sp. IMCC11727 TaxID=3039851 RepID=UPI00244E53A8|nr:MalY/PatB family protein [Amylibacter sp. IMCC11727]WGI22517.1 pyridoxal phosphate-dependent aminotransferase [Amylibacter sp. IMCC11727]